MNIMSPLTPKERQQRRRDKLKASGQYDHYKAKNAEYNKRYRSKLKEELQTLDTIEKVQMLEKKRANERTRQQRYRERKRKAQYSTTVESPKLSSSKNTVDATKYSALSRACNKVRKLLPDCPKKRRDTIWKLASELCVNMTDSGDKLQLSEIVTTTDNSSQLLGKGDSIDCDKDSSDKI